MTTNELVALNWYVKENRQVLQKALKQIKPLSNIEGKVPIYKIERAISVMCNKYGFWLREFVPDSYAGNVGIVWRVSIERRMKIIAVVYGCNLYEVAVKIAIQLYGIVKWVEEWQL